MRTFLIPSATDIQQLATAAGLSIVELSERAGVAPSTVYRWIKGDSVVKVDVAQRLLDAAKPQP